jgi:hypothetical protein
MGTLMRARMYAARRDEDDTGILRFAKKLQPAVATADAGDLSSRSGVVEKL